MKDKNLPRFIQEFPNVAPEILEAWLSNFPENYESIPKLFYLVTSPAIPGDNPDKISKGLFELGRFANIEEAEIAVQTLYFQNREPIVEFGGFAE